MAKRVSLKGKGADLFFGDLAQPTAADPDQAQSPTVSEATVEFEDAATPIDETTADETTATARTTTRSSSPRPKQARKKASLLASTIESEIAATQTETITAIRRTIRTPGREVLFVRLSPEEKTRLGEIVYTFKRQGKKLTETDISRIAINSLLADYDQYGEASILALVLASLHDS